jgi:hypothetical protein
MEFNFNKYLKNNPLLKEDDDSLFGPNIEKSRPGNLSDYYRNAEPPVKNAAAAVDGLLAELVQDKGRLEELADLITDLCDAYAEERIDIYRDGEY